MMYGSIQEVQVFTFYNDVCVYTKGSGIYIIRMHGSVQEVQVFTVQEVQVFIL